MNDKDSLLSKDNSWQLGRVAMLSSLGISHAWGTLLVWAACFGTPSSVIADMFSSVGFMIFSVLAILVGGKGWKDFANMKYGNAIVAPNHSIEESVKISRVVTKDVEPEAKVDKGDTYE